MSKKIFFLLLCILLLSCFKIITSNEENENDHSKKKGFQKEEHFSQNPYLILQIPPWSKFEDVEKKYNKLKDKAEAKNRINTKKFKLYQQAYKAIKKEYKNNNYKEKSFIGVLFKAFKKIIFYELVMLTFLFLSWFVYQFNTYAALLVVTFVAIDNIIPHWFNSMLIQYIVSFILGTIIYFKDYFLGNNKKGNNDNNRDNKDGDGVRQRRRFKKIE